MSHFKSDEKGGTKLNYLKLVKKSPWNEKKEIGRSKDPVKIQIKRPCRSDHLATGYFGEGLKIKLANKKNSFFYEHKKFT